MGQLVQFEGKKNPAGCTKWELFNPKSHPFVTFGLGYLHDFDPVSASPF